MRCLAPTEVRMLNNRGVARVAGTIVGAYGGSQLAASYAWEIQSGDNAYPVIVSIFPDGEHAVAWWYSTEAPQIVDVYVSSRVWEGPWATERRAASGDVIAVRGIGTREGCSPPDHT